MNETETSKFYKQRNNERYAKRNISTAEKVEFFNGGITLQGDFTPDELRFIAELYEETV